MPNQTSPNQTSPNETPTDTAVSEPKTAGRLAALDICRGIAILAVLFIHVSGHFLPALHPAKSHLPPTWAWYALAVPNIGATWAVPCFLMLSAFVNARSLARTPDISSYARRRFFAAVVPYVLWSGVYIAVHSLLSHQPHLSLCHLAKLLLTGTAEFHLYFFVLVIELYLFLPLLVPLFQRHPPFWAVALGTISLQVIVYSLNRFVLVHRFQTTILWDVLPVALGLWLFSQAPRWPEILKRGTWPAIIVALGAAAIYLLLGVAILLPPAHINTALYQFAQWAFTAGMSFAVLALSGFLLRSRLAPLLSYLGAESLAIYVMHPLAIIGLDKLGTGKTVGAGAGFVIYYAACLGLPLAAARIWHLRKALRGGSDAPK